MSLWLGILGGQITATVPGIISYANASQGTGTSLTWDPPSSNGGYPILGYRIEESTDAGESWQNYNDTNNLLTNTYERIGGTDSSLNYHYRISAYNSQGQSAFSYIYVSGNLLPENDPELLAQQENDILSNWDFGSVLFTGVCIT